MAGRNFKSKVFERDFKKDGANFFITENDGLVKVHYLEDNGERIVNAEIIKKFESGYTIIKAEGKTFDYLNNQSDTENNGKLGELEEIYEMQSTGDIITKRVVNKAIEAAKKETFALVNNEQNDSMEKGQRYEVDEKTFQEFKKAYLTYIQNMEKFETQKNIKFSEFVQKTLSGVQGKSIASFDSLSKVDLSKKNTKSTFDYHNESGNGYSVKNDTQHDKRYLSVSNNGNEQAIEILGFKKRPAGYSSIRCSSDYYNDWADRRVGSYHELNSDVNFLVSPEGELYNITESERDKFTDKSIEVTQEFEKNRDNDKLAQETFIKNMKSNVLNKQGNSERN